jgi:hypothetical protein
MKPSLGADLALPLETTDRDQVQTSEEFVRMKKMRQAQLRVLEAMATGRKLIEATHELPGGRQRRYWFVAADAKVGASIKVHKADFLALKHAGYLSQHGTIYSLTQAGRDALEGRR